MTQDTGTALINIDRAIFANDFGALTQDERVLHGKRMCESIGIRYETQPIKWILMKGGKWVPYAGKDASDQLRAKHNISVEVTSRDVKDGLITVHARATAPSGRRDEDFGVVPVAGLRGDEAANAVMKAVTKAKRRVTLSICGLGMMDESEIASLTPTFDDLGHGSIRSTPTLTSESLPPSEIKQPPEAPIEKPVEPHEIERDGDDEAAWRAWTKTLLAHVRAAPDANTINEWTTENFEQLTELQKASVRLSAHTIDEINAEIAKHVTP